MTDPMYHTRQDYINKTGKRISRGGWERLNRAYAVHAALDSRGRNKFETVVVDGQRGLRQCTTVVLMPDTTKANRKVDLVEPRYQGTPLGYVK